MRVLIGFPLTLTMALAVVLVNTVSGFSIEDEVRITDTVDQEWQPVLAIDDEGCSYMVYHLSPNHSLFFSKVSPEGLTLIGPVMITMEDMKDPTYGDIKVDGSGRVHIAFFAYRINVTGRDILYCQLDEDGLVRIPTRWVTNSTAYSSHVRMDIDGQGNVYLVWREMSDPQEIMWCNLSTDGTPTEPAVAVSKGMNDSVEAHRPRISVSAAGESQVFWQGRTDEGSPWMLYFSRVSPTGQVLVGPTRILPDGDAECTYIGVALEEGIGVHTVYVEHGPDGWLANYALVTPDGGVSDITSVVGPSEAEIDWVDVAITSNGDRVFAFAQEDGTDYRLLRIGMRMVSRGNDARRSFDITGFEDFGWIPKMDGRSDRVVVCYMRDGDIYQRAVDASIPNYPPSPVLTCDTTSAETDERISFSGEGSHDLDVGDYITGFLFDWGDGTATEWGSSPTADYRFSEPGVYTVTLEVRDSQGLASEDHASVTLVIEEVNVGPSEGVPLWVILVVVIAVVVLLIFWMARSRD
jgi:hypothetical protein